MRKNKSAALRKPDILESYYQVLIQEGLEGASISKIAKASTNQRLQELALDLLGANAAAWPVDDGDAKEWNAQFLRTRANSIEGGTSEIQRNIVGERVLGLPREPDAFKGAPWRSVPRS